MNYIEAQKMIENHNKIEENMKNIDELTDELDKSKNDIQSHCIGKAVTNEFDEMFETLESMSDEELCGDLTEEEAEELLVEAYDILEESYKALGYIKDQNK